MGRSLLQDEIRSQLEMVLPQLGIKPGILAINTLQFFAERYIITHKETQMFTPQFFIDAVQSTKRGVFKQIVQDPELQKVSDRYIDAQTEFANMLINNTISIARYSFDKVTQCFLSKKEQASRAPYKVEKEAN